MNPCDAERGDQKRETKGWGAIKGGGEKKDCFTTRERGPVQLSGGGGGGGGGGWGGGGGGGGGLWGCVSPKTAGSWGRRGKKLIFCERERRKNPPVEMAGVGTVTGPDRGGEKKKRGNSKQCLGARKGENRGIGTSLGGGGGE